MKETTSEHAVTALDLAVEMKVPTHVVYGLEYSGKIKPIGFCKSEWSNRIAKAYDKREALPVLKKYLDSQHARNELSNMSSSNGNEEDNGADHEGRNLVTARKLGKALGVSAYMLRRFRDMGMPHYSFGKTTIRYDLDECIGWVEGNMRR